ncbi:MAG TPA: GxxExxY protein [Gemmatimonadaceae bacterium]|nr:GxxExxY protein [Gemmatimonadaceae bacterium]
MPVALVERALVGSIIDSFYAVYNYFGFGLAEVVYAGALELELLDRGHAVARELAVAVAYKGRHVAWQRLDMVVDDKVIVELKATDKLPPFAARQLINYLHATTFQVGLVLHFGPEPVVQRYVHTRKNTAAQTG